MAERRMFTQKIIDSDAFLDMPLSAQALYFHLSMRADDDGFVNNPKKIQRIVYASEDDLKLLILKRFLLCFESGVIVIKHWRMHNSIRRDRYTPTQYQEEFSRLGIKQNGAYTENAMLPESSDDEPLDDVATDWQPDGNQAAPQVRLGKDRLGKVRIGEDIEPPAAPLPAPDADEKGKKPVRHKYGEYKNVLLSDDDLAKLKAEFPDWEKRIERLSSYIAQSGKTYKNHLATIRNWAKRDQEKDQSKRGSQGYDDDDLDFIPN